MGFRAEITRGEHAQSLGDFEDAEEAFLSALALAENQGNPDLVAEATFSLAYLYEVWGEASSEEREEFLKKALTNYRRAAQPSSSPIRFLAMNNLGYLYLTHFSSSMPKAKEEAGQIFKEILESVPPTDPSRPIYDLNHGRALETLGRVDDAKKAYYQAFVGAPGFASPVHALTRILLNSKPVPFDEYASLVDRLGEQRKHDLAQEALRTGLDRSVKERDRAGSDAMLKALLHHYARSLVKPKKFLEEEEPFLWKLASEDNYLRTPVTEVSQVYKAELPEYTRQDGVDEAFTYWGREGYRENLGELANMLGDFAKSYGELRKAPSFYSLSIASNPKRSDAAVSLASLILQDPEIARDERYLETLVPLTESESARENWTAEDLLRLHAVFGSIFLEQSRPTAALVHFKSAINYDQLLHEKSASAPRSPGLYESTARVYFAAGKAAQAQQLFLKAAEDYLHNYDVEGTSRSVQAIGEIDSPLTDDDKARMDSIRLWVDRQRAYQPPFCEFEIIESTCTGENAFKVGEGLCQHCWQDNRCPDTEITLTPWDIPTDAVAADPASDRKCHIRLRPSTRGACVSTCQPGHYLIPVGTRRD